jgi:hypothetical protein
MGKEFCPMIHAGSRFLVCSAFFAVMAAGSASSAWAQGVERAPAPTPQQVAIAQDARETREEFEGLLRRLPPSVGRVLRLDPSLMRNPAYLQPYPALATFLQQHPDVLNNPSYYLENVQMQLWYPPEPRDPRSDAISMWRNVIQDITMVFVFLIVASGLLWIIRSVLEYRRWLRTSRVQTEVHTKLLDRFTANEDLLAYIQTPVGRRFLESAPIPVEAPARPVGAPYTRILWSLQAGLVLAAAGFGFLFVSGRVIDEVAQVFFAVGVLALAVGVGFVVSAAASLLLSQRLGLLDAGSAREHSGATGV